MRAKISTNYTIYFLFSLIRSKYFSKVSNMDSQTSQKRKLLQYVLKSCSKVCSVIRLTQDTILLRTMLGSSDNIRMT